MAFEYQGTYYPTLASQRMAILRSELKPEQVRVAQAIATSQVPKWNRNSQPARDLQTYEVARALFPGEPQQQQSAPSGGGGGGGGGGGNAAAQQLAELTSQSQAYRKEAEAAIEAGKLQISQLQDQELQRQKAAELQNRLAIQAQTSQARGAAQASLKIAPASQTAQTAGTQAFKRRRDQMRLAPIQSTAGINAPASSVLNV